MGQMVLYIPVTVPCTEEGVRGGLGGRGRGKDTTVVLLAQMKELLFQWQNGVTMPRGVRRPGSSPGSTTPLAYDLGQALALSRLIVFFCKGLGLDDPP